MSDVATHEEVPPDALREGGQRIGFGAPLLGACPSPAQDPKSDDNFDAELERMLWDGGD